MCLCLLWIEFQTGLLKHSRTLGPNGKYLIPFRDGQDGIVWHLQKLILPRSAVSSFHPTWQEICNLTFDSFACVCVLCVVTPELNENSFHYRLLGVLFLVFQV